MGEARRKRLVGMVIGHLGTSAGQERFSESSKKIAEATPDIPVLTHPVSNNPRHYAHIEPPKGYVRDLIDHMEDKPHTKTYTPAAEWRERGEPDPHAGRYDNLERHQIMGGQFTDDEIAFKCGMASGRDLESISTLHMAKERIRWLSRKLVAAEKRVKELEGE